jgi:acylphosphatase
VSAAGSQEAGGDREVVRRIVRIRGRVQGVGYRMSVADAAARLGVAGTVRNLLDGTVEADVEGPPAAVEAMLEALRQGPPSAQVESVEARPEAPRGAGSFRITG